MIENPPAPSATPSKPGWVWAVLAACCPLAACPVTPAVAIGTGGNAHDPARLFVEGGALAYGTLAVFSLGAIALAVLVALLARGTKVPVTLMVLLSALPWLLGVAGMRVGLGQVVAAVNNVNPADKATLLAAGIAEASACRLLGTFLTSGLCAAAAIGLGLAAIGNASKPAPGGLLALLAAAPLFVACLAVPNFRELGPVAFLVVLPAGAFVLAAGLGGLGGASGSPRSAVILATVGVPAALAVVALARGIAVAGLMKVFGAVGSVAGEDKATIMLAGTSELASADKLAFAALVLGGAGALALFGFAASRVEDKKPLIVELLLCAGIAILAVEADTSAVSAAANAMNGFDHQPWERVSGFQPLHAEGSVAREDTWVLTPERLIPPGGEAIDAPFSPDGQAKLAERLRGTAQVRERYDGLATAGWAVAVDRRVASADFAKLVEVARDAQLSRLTVVGKTTEHPIPPGSSTWWIGLLGSTGSESFELRPLPDFYGESKPPKLVTADDVAHGNVDSRYRPALALADFSLQQLLDTATTLRADRRAAPLLVGPGGLDALEEEEGADRDEDEAEGGVEGGDDLDPKVKGKLPALLGKDSSLRGDPLGEAPGTVGDLRSGIAAGVRAHVNEFKYCYESRLTKRPDLRGKVVLQFTIGSSGAVTAAKVSSSQLDDPALEDCLLNRMKRVKFGVHPKTPTEVSYPFVFSPGDR